MLLLSYHSKQASYKPTAEDAAKAKALINFLMQDRFFLALYRSDDPKVRAAAMDKLNKAHHLAYGDVPTEDDDAASCVDPTVTLSDEALCPPATKGPRGRILTATSQHVGRRNLNLA